MRGLGVEYKSVVENQKQIPEELKAARVRTFLQSCPYHSQIHVFPDHVPVLLLILALAFMLEEMSISVRSDGS